MGSPKLSSALRETCPGNLVDGDSNGKIATVVLNLVVLAVFILPITTYAQQTMTQKDNRQDKSDIESEGES